MDEPCRTSRLRLKDVLMIHVEFSPGPATLGGVLIGLSASLMLLTTGRIAGISGIYGGMLQLGSQDRAWRLAFLLGLLIAGAGFMGVVPEAIASTDTRSGLATAAAGLFVGFGVRMGSGCTSGHGVCGLSRFSRRSLVATLAFMATGMLTATGIQLLSGGAL